MPKNIFAYTAPGGDYPEYISINETDDPNLFTVTVRSAPTRRQGEQVHEGATATITLTMPQIVQMSGDIVRAVTGTAV